MTITLDHLAVAGETLEDAVATVEQALGVQMQPGGQHDVFNTHNAVMGMADGLYLEAIAADPSKPAPHRPRWFDLDNFHGPARLTNWICRSDDLPKVLHKMPLGAGEPVALSRGDLRWRMAVPGSGKLPFDNLFPPLIQWDCDVHPAWRLPNTGVRLRRLIVSHPEVALLRGVLVGQFADPRVVFEAGAPALRAEFDTPHGVRSL